MWKGYVMAANADQRMAWDSCVIIDCLQKKVGRYEFIRPLVEQAEAKDLMIVVSAAMAVAETFKITGHPPEDEVREIEAFFDRPWVHPEDAGSAIGKIARDLRRAYGIDGADALHIATAVFTSCPVFLTNDGVSPKKKTPLLPLDNQIKLADGTLLRIMTPEQYHKMRVAAENPLLANALGHPPPNPAESKPGE